MGIFDDEEKNFTSLTFAEIYSKEVLVHKFQKNMISKSDGNMGAYNRGFWHFKHNYRGRYSPKFLKKYGFQPVGSGIKYVLKKDEYLDYIKNNYDSQASLISQTKIDVGKLDYQVKFYLEKNGYNWSNYHNELIIEYTGSNASELCCSGQPGVLEPTCCEENTSGSGSSSGGSCDGQEPSCKVIYNVLNVEYANLSNDPNVPDDTSVIRATFRNSDNPNIKKLVMEIHNDFPNLALYSTYRRDSGETEFYHYIKDRASSDFLFEALIREYSAIVPIKEWGQLHLEEKNIKKMLKKYSLAPDDLMESFNKLDEDGEPEVDNAYLYTGMTLKDPYAIEEIGTFDAKDIQHLSSKFLAKCQRSADGERYTITQANIDWWKEKNRLRRRKYARMMFDLMEYYGTGSTNITMKAASMTYNIEMKIEEKNGIIDGATRTDGTINTRYADFERGFIEVEQPYEYFRPCGKKPEINNNNSDISYLLDSGSGGADMSSYQDMIKYNSCMREHGYKYNFIDGEFSNDTYDSGSGWGVVKQPWLGNQNDNKKKNRCKFSYTDEEIEAIANGGTLPVKCPGTIIRRQVTDSTYKKMFITELNEMIWISGHWFKLEMDGSWTSDSDNTDDQTLNRGGPGEKYPRLVYPLELLNGLDFMSYVIAKEYGTIFMVYTIKTVETKWYEKFIGILFAIIVCVAFTAGCGLVDVLINIAISYAVQYAVTLVLSLIDSPLLKALFQIVVVIVAAYFGGINSLDKLAENFLPLANDLTGIVVNAYTEIQMRELQEEREHQENLEAGNRIQEGIDAMDEPIMTVAPMDKSVHSGFLQSNGAEAFYAQALDALFNFDIFFDAGASVEMRSQVVSG